MDIDELMTILEKIGKEETDLIEKEDGKLFNWLRTESDTITKITVD
jgi:hypothetical protein